MYLYSLVCLRARACLMTYRDSTRQFNIRTFNLSQVCKLSPGIHELLYNAMGENMTAIDFDKSVGKTQ